MSTNASPDRPNRLVVALGIATIVLFSANLLAMLSQRVWPKLQDLASVGPNQDVEEVATATPHAERNMMVFRHRQSPSVYQFHVMKKRSKRCFHGRSAESSDAVFEHSLETDMNQLERDIEREMERLNGEISGVNSEAENPVRVRLRVVGDRAVQLDENRLDLAELEKKIEGITRQFEVRIREHEAAARQRAGQSGQ
jgi:hypothetical protein